MNRTMKRYWTNRSSGHFVEVLYPFLKRLGDDFRRTSIYVCNLDFVTISDISYLKVYSAPFTGNPALLYLRENKKRLVEFTDIENEIVERPFCEIELSKWYERIPLSSKLKANK